MSSHVLNGVLWVFAFLGAGLLCMACGRVVTGTLGAVIGVLPFTIVLAAFLNRGKLNRHSVVKGVILWGSAGIGASFLCASFLFPIYGANDYWASRG